MTFAMSPVAKPTPALSRRLGFKVVEGSEHFTEHTDRQQSRQSGAENRMTMSFMRDGPDRHRHDRASRPRLGANRIQITAWRRG